MNVDEIRRVLMSNAGIELKKYLRFRLEELRNIDNLDEYSTAAMQALELKAQRRAYYKLDEILSELTNISEEPVAKDDRDGFNVV
jgi:hypothetical protein